MNIRSLGRVLSLQAVILGLLALGCHAPKQPEPAAQSNGPAVSGISEEIRAIAEQALGKQADVIAHGDLAKQGTEQILVADRFAALPGAPPPDRSAPVFLTRAAILEKDSGKWTEIFRCDEHLKNPSGYLGGSTLARINGWRMEVKTPKQGLELTFTPVIIDSSDGDGEMGGLAGQGVMVRWNPAVRRYQSLDPSHTRFLNESTELETPSSILK